METLSFKFCACVQPQAMDPINLKWCTTPSRITSQLLLDLNERARQFHYMGVIVSSSSRFRGFKWSICLFKRTLLTSLPVTIRRVQSLQRKQYRMQLVLPFLFGTAPGNMLDASILVDPSMHVEEDTAEAWCYLLPLTSIIYTDEKLKLKW